MHDSWVSPTFICLGFMANIQKYTHLSTSAVHGVALLNDHAVYGVLRAVLARVGQALLMIELT
jgi:hypothetical protein